MNETPLIRVKNWANFQHYKQRRPPWIKLYRELLDDFTYSRLQYASRALAPCIWLLASESPEGTIPFDLPFLVFRLREPEYVIVEALKELTDKDFLECLHGASEMLAARYRELLLETEKRQRREEERQRNETTVAPYGAAAPTDARPMPDATPVDDLSDNGGRARNQSVEDEAAEDEPAKRRGQNGTKAQRALIDRCSLVLGQKYGYTVANADAARRAQGAYAPEQIAAILGAVEQGATPTAVWCSERLSGGLPLAYILRPGPKGAADRILDELGSAKPARASSAVAVRSFDDANPNWVREGAAFVNESQEQGVDSLAAAKAWCSERGAPPGSDLLLVVESRKRGREVVA